MAANPFERDHVIGSQSECEQLQAVEATLNGLPKTLTGKYGGGRHAVGQTVAMFAIVEHPTLPPQSAVSRAYPIHTPEIFEGQGLPPPFLNRVFNDRHPLGSDWLPPPFQ